MTPIVHIGIVAYNSAADLPACLTAARAQIGIDVTITVWDNASSDASAASAQAASADMIGTNENVGFGRGHNGIIAHRQPRADDFYLALNPDCELAPDYAARLVERLHLLNREEPDGRYGFACGKLLLKDEAGAIYSVGHAMTRAGKAFNIAYGWPDDPDAAWNQPREVFGAPGAAALYSGALIADIAEDGAFALFDRDIFLYAEDTDVDWRARYAGWRCVYEPAAVALHHGSRPASESALNVLILGNRYLSATRNAAGRDLPLVLLTMIAHTAARLVITPRFGLRMALHIARRFLTFWRKRGHASPTRADANLAAWWAWAATQPRPKRAKDKHEDTQAHRHEA